MIKEYMRLLKARNWMKKNEPFLYSWHVYVGYELDLFHKFRFPVSVNKIAMENSYQKELLQQWVEVGIAVKNLKEGRDGAIKTAKRFMIPDRKDNPRSTGIILKEMMELHIPILLTYPNLIKSNEKNIFDHKTHGQTVAQTSSLLEQLAFPKFLKLIKKNHYHSVLDIGCGHAGYLSRLAKNFSDIKLTGIELNQEVAASAQKRCENLANIQIEQADFKEFEPAGHVDFIMMNNLLHYIDPAERAGVLKKVSRWVTEKGQIAIMTPIGKDEKGAQFSSAFNSFFSAFENLYPVPSMRDMKKMAECAGLRIETFKPIIREGGWYLVTLENRKGEK
ncbi:class I SAM-dependent methyltransferase [Bacillus sp. MUM 13]|uniref:class I SAM-dependent methyltransferase n=1 Tax=Bacillus sp. MUM 13 TaxID=1678001 RepID=UPI0008F5E8E7|nr:class I SAM-dependent methyltransferase [Bacillus sp. MUM 13]OIK11659.1 methyltransferase type 12 [Bacillus sp. MUM 13]